MLAQSAAELTDAAMRLLGLDPEKLRMFVVLSTAQAQRLLESGVKAAEMLAVIQWCAKLLKDGDRSPQLQNLVYLWRPDVFPNLLDAATADLMAESDPTKNPISFENLMRTMGAVTTPQIHDEEC